MDRGAVTTTTHAPTYAHNYQRDGKDHGSPPTPGCLILCPATLLQRLCSTLRLLSSSPPPCTLAMMCPRS
jgi:hypothetical protein